MMGSLFFLLAMASPFAAMVAWAALFFKGKRLGLYPALWMFIALSLLGGWSILQSHSSTAAIGFLFLPFYATVGAVGTWFYINHRQSPQLVSRAFAWIGVMACIGIIGLHIQGGIANISKHKQREEEHQQRKIALLSKKQEMTALLTAYKGSAADFLSEQITSHLNDPLILAVTLEFPDVTANDLERVYNTNKISDLIILRHPNITTALVEKIYKETDDDGKYYLFADMAFNTKTPEWILRDIYKRQGDIFGEEGINHFLASNPATPPDLLLKMTTSKRTYVIQSLMRNPHLDCDLTRRAQRGLSGTENPDDKITRELIVKRLKELCSK